MLILDRAELEALTGYVQPARQAEWLRERLRIVPPRRADGMPIVSRQQVEAALAGQRVQQGGPRWSVPA